MEKRVPQLSGNAREAIEQMAKGELLTFKSNDELSRSLQSGRAIIVPAALDDRPPAPKPELENEHDPRSNRYRIPGLTI